MHYNNDKYMNIDLETILAFDIETAPYPDFGEENPLWDTWRHRWRKENLTDEELLAKYHKEAGLYAEYSQIVCISVGYRHAGKFVVTSITGDEKTIIDQFLARVEKFMSKKGKVKYLGHNIQNFDACYLRKRYAKYHPMSTYPTYITDLGLKPWTAEERFIDTLQIWKGMNFMFSSMAEVAIHLGLPSPKSDTDGSMVAQLFKEGKIDDIARYCEGDVYTSFNILSKWLGEPILEMEVKENTPVKPIPILKKAIPTSSIPEDDLEKLNAVIEELPDSEKEIAADILTAVTSKTKIQKQK